MSEKVTELPPGLRQDHYPQDGLYVGVEQVPWDSTCTQTPEMTAGQDFGSCHHEEVKSVFIDDKKGEVYVSVGPIGKDETTAITKYGQGDKIENGFQSKKRWKDISFKRDGWAGVQYCFRGAASLSAEQLKGLPKTPEVYATVLENWEKQEALGKNTDLVKRAAFFWATGGESAYETIAVRTLKKLLDEKRMTPEEILGAIWHSTSEAGFDIPIALQSLVDDLVRTMTDPATPLDQAQHMAYRIYCCTQTEKNHPYLEKAHDVLWRLANDLAVDSNIRFAAASSLVGNSFPSEQPQVVDILFSIAGGPAVPGLNRANVISRILGNSSSERAQAILQNLLHSDSFEETFSAAKQLRLDPSGLGDEARKKLYQIANDSTVPEKTRRDAFSNYLSAVSQISQPAIDLGIRFSHDSDFKWGQRYDFLKTLLSKTLDASQQKQILKEILAMAKKPDEGYEAFAAVAELLIAQAFLEDTTLQREAAERLTEKLNAGEYGYGLVDAAYFLLNHGSRQEMRMSVASWLIARCHDSEGYFSGELLKSAVLQRLADDKELSFTAKAEAGRLLRKMVPYNASQETKQALDLFIAENQAKADGKESHLVVMLGPQ